MSKKTKNLGTDLVRRRYVIGRFVFVRLDWQLGLLLVLLLSGLMVDATRCRLEIIVEQVDRVAAGVKVVDRGIWKGYNHGSLGGTE